MPILDAIMIGRIEPFGPSGQQSAIRKKQVTGAVRIDETGIQGDEHAYHGHGGPDKAALHYAAEHYADWAAAFPHAAERFAAGVTGGDAEGDGERLIGLFGENFSSHGMTEKSVCIGDIFRIGEVLVQVSQPRTPCWKISHRFGIDKLSKFVEEHRITGWYYRVLETGSLHRGDPVKLVERPNEGVTIRDFLDVRNQHRPAPQALDRLINCIGLNQAWREKLSQRKAFLAALGQETNSRGQGNPA